MEHRSGAQTERRCGAGPVRGLLGGKDLTGRFVRFHRFLIHTSIGVHTPWQEYPSGHTTPHAPQLELSKSVLVQCPLQRVPPGSQLLHVPPLQFGASAGHTLPQAPQLFGSVATYVHLPLQLTVPGAHSYWHRPETQMATSPGGGAAHTTPHRPQLSMSLERSAQWPPQQVAPKAPQLLPQAPQLGSEVRLLHTPRHAAFEQQT
jgi:hypothetical protein